VNTEVSIEEELREAAAQLRDVIFAILPDASANRPRALRPASVRTATSSNGRLAKRHSFRRMTTCSIGSVSGL